jgi:hypothetical protein
MLRAILPLLLLVTAACDPCAGVGTCSVPQVRYEGILNKLFANPPGPAEGIRVKFVRTAGVEIEADSLVGRSDAEGRFRLEGRTRGEGEVSGNLWIYPPDTIAPVRVEGVRMLTSRVPGDLRRLGEWKVPYPHFSYQGVLYYRATGRPATGIEVKFRRTGGIPLDSDTFRVVSDQFGHFNLRPKTSIPGEVTGEITIFLLPPYKPYTIKELKLTTFLEPRPDSLIRIGIGSRLPYSAILVWENNGQGVGGVEVVFQRTDGVLISPERFVTSTDQHGTVHLNPAPLTSGEVVGDVYVRPPPPGRAFVIRDLRLKTVDDDRAHELLGYWGVPIEKP